MAGINLSLPFLIINMGGEMVYILNQRLIAQKIPPEKSEKVRADVIKHMFSEAFIRELIVPQPLYSMTSTRQVFDKIAQSSIMKLQTSSMNKLFDLMLMGLKLQLLTLTYPEELLKITLNHIQELKNLITSRESLLLLEFTSEILIKTYSSYSSAVYNRIRQTLLRFFQNRNVKVTMFLHSGIQLQDGTIKIEVNNGIPFADIPGKITKQGTENVKTLPVTCRFRRSALNSRHPLHAQTILGLNLYDSNKEVITAQSEEQKEESITMQNDIKRGAIARWELDSLANMIYCQNDEDGNIPHVTLFNDVDIEIKEHTVSEVTGMIKNTHLDKLQNIFEDTKENKKKNEEDDLLDLL